MARPVTTGESPHVTFRAKPPLGDALERRRAYPDVRNDPLSLPRGAKLGDTPAIGAVAARDLIAFYRMLEAELAEAAAELTWDQVIMIVDAVNGLITDFTWLTNAPMMLASEVEAAYGDDEDGPDVDRAKLVAAIHEWPMLRAFAVLEAALLTRSRANASDDFDALLVEVGLQLPPRRARSTR